jgi:hypothetical protein
VASLLSVVDRGGGRPIGNAPVIFADLVKELKAQTDRLTALDAGPLAAFNAEAERLGLERCGDDDTSGRAFGPSGVFDGGLA